MQGFFQTVIYMLMCYLRRRLYRSWPLWLEPGIKPTRLIPIMHKTSTFIKVSAYRCSFKKRDCYSSHSNVRDLTLRLRGDKFRIQNINLHDSWQLSISHFILSLQSDCICFMSKYGFFPYFFFHFTSLYYYNICCNFYSKYQHFLLIYYFFFFLHKKAT